MSKMKKMFAVIAAATMLCGSFSAMSVSATYDPCDVNQDGTVNMVDSLAISQHLSGVVYYTDYHLLDVNRSHTVDATDLNYITKKLLTGTTPSTCYIAQYGNGFMQPVTMPSVSSTITLDSSVNATNDHWYIGYSYLEDEFIEEYKLTATTASVSTAQNPRGIVGGEDNRVVAHGYENTGIVYLNGATGFIVGDHQIATAAHVVFNTEIDEFVQNIDLATYDRSGNKVAGGSLTAVEVHVPVEYAELTAYAPYNDYALVTVEEDLSEHVHFAIGNSYNMKASEVGTIPIHVTGNPQTVGGVTNSTNSLYTDFGSVYGEDNSFTICYTTDTSGGQSGSPVYTITRERYNNNDYYTYTVLAVHSGGNTTRNRGSLMTKYHQQFYNNNPYADY